jgi:LuxR family transcriptional regulator, maltose regulon positive regulatory protein
MLVDGAIRIDRQKCWIDVWAFEHLNRLAGLAWQAGDQQSYLRHAQKALQLFQTDFFAADDDTWVLGCRERLRAQFLDVNNALARFWECRREWSESLTRYRIGLEVDNLSEECYQGAMRCYKNLGFYAEAVEVYHRCKRTLSLSLGTKPSPATEKLYRSLITR